MNRLRDETLRNIESVEPGLILFMVGTHHMPFGRLVQWADAWKRDHPAWDVLVQYGSSNPPQIARGEKNLTREQMDQLSSRVKAVILPGGPSLMMEWIRRGVRPILVPRNPELNEHIDEHQIRFSKAMVEVGLVDCVYGNNQSIAKKDLFEIVEKSIRRREGVPSLNTFCETDFFDLAKTAQNLGEVVYSAISKRG